jgi:hypothetical protein
MKKPIAITAVGLVLAATIGSVQAQQNGYRMNRGGPGMMQMPSDYQNHPMFGRGGYRMMGPGMMGPGMMMGGMMGPEMMVLMMDTDNDGNLSLEEFQAVHTRMFNYLDKNGDGQLTGQELRNRWQQDDEDDDDDG